ncbi:hypothetical protein KY317_00780 [Candidatus Woesearchaeota archaeon]|nr:hypothetical protein [Candidatus Woesearchaeota archaeon]
MIKDICKLKECPECASTNIIHSKQREQVICRDCGLIYEPMVPDQEEKFERVSGIRKLGRGIKKAAGRLRRKKTKVKTKKIKTTKQKKVRTSKKKKR